MMTPTFQVPALTQSLGGKALSGRRMTFGMTAQVVAGQTAVGVARGAVANVAREAGPPLKNSRLMSYLDYHSLGETTVNLIKAIYVCMITSRIAAAATRSYNELREASIKDSMGYVSWLFLVPILQRGMLGLLTTTKEFRGTLVRQTEKPAREGLKGTLKWLNWNVNPISRFSITSRGQINDSRHLALEQLQKLGHAVESEAVQKATRYFKTLLFKRDLVTGLSVLFTIGMLGVILPLINIAVTRRNVAEGKIGKTRH